MPIIFVYPPGEHCHLYFMWGERRRTPAKWTCTTPCGRHYNRWNGA